MGILGFHTLDDWSLPERPQPGMMRGLCEPFKHPRNSQVFDCWDKTMLSFPQSMMITFLGAFTSFTLFTSMKHMFYLYLRIL